MDDRPEVTRPRGQRSDAARNREAIIQTARELFDRRGIGVPLDEIARLARVGNATLYRHFPSRVALVTAVYDDEVAALCDLGATLGDERDRVRALFAWLTAFVEHVVTRRELALSIPAEGDARGTVFTDWHMRMRTTGSALLDNAIDIRAVRDDVPIEDLLALANGIGLSGSDELQRSRLLTMVRESLVSPMTRET